LTGHEAADFEEDLADSAEEVDSGAEAEILDTAETENEGLLKCTKPLALNAESNAKSRSSQQETSLFIAVTVLEMKIQEINPHQECPQSNSIKLTRS
jgi:hypothetical protein